MVLLNEFAIGDVALGNANAPLRESPPSLVGASILSHFMVTLDYKTSTAYFHQYRDGPFSRHSFEFGLAFDNVVSMSMVWDDSLSSRRIGRRRWSKKQLKKNRLNK